jgi:hypothetical protein
VSRDIYDLAKDATRVGNPRGLIRCDIEDPTDRILAFEFDTPEHARGFCDGRYGARIAPGRPTTVLVREP